MTVFQTKTIQKTGPWVRCKHCAYEWLYTGKRPFAQCPRCHTTVNLNPIRVGNNSRCRRNNRIPRSNRYKVPLQHQQVPAQCAEADTSIASSPTSLTTTMENDAPCTDRIDLVKPSLAGDIRTILETKS